MDFDTFNTASPDELRPVLQACCAAPTWVDAVIDGRPYADTAAVVRAADEAGRRFTSADVDQALAAHPRIGERAEGEHAEAAWSRREQAAVGADQAAAQALAEGNRAYEERFDRVFLICASGLSADRILASLNDRLGNDPDTEAAVVADELRKIALLRLERVLVEEATA
ncbi:2-oxo-4-hydroxy-4-carboxy-5-ureidoimidazoline decarboxylase [Nocardioides albus]|uniref:2-oxo-4-hydroxy-4-carboxy-5-ureidoimidazoline decarboxylase n=1 Tax=Nocardioides albus TaxID=1841 RepID=A0A7W5A2J0_9ACTN|nr:2-oxo-4-hydroxy-4-carboxy-5-ureidoimidazoline decarboxylase [Nocardioides albus]MBB3088341.1 2-oxo-4-hydroxy-4-carboxy-5-ureidoimidazoline decarboxylase [Nocardioides albus]GGU42136.1 OHCU decarboxylase [Nocardioides albus]